MDYSDRKLTFVGISRMQNSLSPDGEPTIGADVTIQVSAYDGSDHGPVARIRFSIASSPEKTITQIEQELQDAALALLTRLSKETPTTFRESLLNGRKPLFPKDKSNPE